MRQRFRVSEVFRKDMRPRLEDPYKPVKKYRSNTECPGCGLVFQKGVWKRSQGAGTIQQRKLCPACLRAQQDYPGGVLRLSGGFLTVHHKDILGRIEGLAQEAEREHPLERVIRVREESGELLVYATNEHLIARLGKALHRDFKGTLDLEYAPGQNYAVAHWRRDA
jgi:hypothetical protein